MLATFSFSTDLLALRRTRARAAHAPRRPSASSPRCPPTSTACATGAAWPRARIADVVVFDEATVGPEEVSTRFDLPGGAGRLYAGAHGVDHVRRQRRSRSSPPAGSPAPRPGTLLRSGRDTANPSLA